MPNKLKINTALLLCAVFVLKMFFVGISVIPSLNARQNSSCETSLSSANMKNRQFDALHSSLSCDDLIAEIYEENEENKDNDDASRSGSFVLIQVLYALLTDNTENKARLSSFNHYFSSGSSSRYLQYRVFRI